MIRTRTIGILNILPEKHYVFFWEYDNVEISEVIEEAKFISDCFEIDIDILESSKGNYHLVSYDIIDLEILRSIQNWLSIEQNYLRVDDTTLRRKFPIGITKGNVLRLGIKNKKESPKFVIRIGNHEYKNKSFQHFKFYQYYCHVPEFTLKQFWFNMKTELIVYASINKNRDKTPLEHKLDRKVYILSRNS